MISKNVTSLSTKTDGETKARETTHTVTLRRQEQKPSHSSLGPHPSAKTESRFGFTTRHNNQKRVGFTSHRSSCLGKGGYIRNPMKPTFNLTYNLRNRPMAQSVDNSHLVGCRDQWGLSYEFPHPKSKPSSLIFYSLSFYFCQITNPLGRNNTLSYYWSFLTCELKLWESVWELLRKRIWGYWEQKDVKIQERGKTSKRQDTGRKAASIL